MDELLGRRKVEMFENHRRQQCCRSAAVELSNDRGQCGATDPEAATLVAEEIPPSPGSSGASSGVASVCNGSRARNDHDTRCIAGTCHKRDKRVVDNDD